MVPENPLSAFNKASAEKLAAEERAKKMQAISDDMAKGNYERVEKNATELAREPARIRETAFRQSCERLVHLRTMAEANTKLFSAPLNAAGPSLTAVLNTITGEMTSAGERRLSTISEALQAPPPAPPASINEDIDTLTGSDPASRYLTINRDRGTGDQPRLFYVTINSRIHQDIGYVNTLLQAYQNDPNPAPPQRALERQALQTLHNRLVLYAQQDLFRYESYQAQQQQNNSVTSRGIATMGKFIGVLGFLTYALADGAMAFAHGRMPTGLLVGGVGAALIADRRLCRQVFDPPEQRVAEEVNGVVNSSDFQRLAKTYGIYGNANWSEAMRNIMSDTGSATNTFLARVRAGRAEATEIREFAGNFSGNAEVKAKIILMMGTVHSDGLTMTGVSDFDVLRNLLRNRSRDAQEATIAMIQARGRPTGPLPPAPVV